MSRDPLLAVVRLRRMALDDASREFAECLRREAEAEQAASAVEAAIVREADAATSLTADDAVVEAFGKWLKRARNDLRAAQTAQENAEIETTRVRAVLQAARAAVKAAEQMLAEKQASERATLARREQADLDETGLRSRR
ncbi:MAG TPA: flagellar FliJ family protein [Acetobacteraceae bacterium]